MTTSRLPYGTVFLVLVVMMVPTYFAATYTWHRLDHETAITTTFSQNGSMLLMEASFDGDIKEIKRPIDYLEREVLEVVDTLTVQRSDHIRKLYTVVEFDGGGYPWGLIIITLVSWGLGIAYIMKIS